jgi:hypothetical protein
MIGLNRLLKELGKPNLRKPSSFSLNFWTAFRTFMEEHSSRLKATKPFPKHWMNLALGRTEFGLGAIASLSNSNTNNYDCGELRTEVQVSAQNAKSFYSALETQKHEIEQELNESLTWHNPENKNMCRIYLRRDAHIKDKSDWPHRHEWLMENLDKLYASFNQRITRLEVPEAT